MKHTVLSIASWFASDPRRMAALMLALVLLFALAAAVLPSDVALAGEITSGS